MRARERGEGAHLVEDVRLDLVGLRRDRTASEPAQVPVAGMRAHGHPAADGQGDRAVHHARVAAVEAAGDVGGRDEGEHAGVVAERVGSEALAQVGVQVDPHPIPGPARRPAPGRA